MRLYATSGESQSSPTPSQTPLILAFGAYYIIKPLARVFARSCRSVSASTVALTSRAWATKVYLACPASTRRLVSDETTPTVAPRGRPHSRHFARTPSPERRNRLTTGQNAANGLAGLPSGRPPKLPRSRLHTPARWGLSPPLSATFASLAAKNHPSPFRGSPAGLGRLKPTLPVCRTPSPERGTGRPQAGAAISLRRAVQPRRTSR